MLSHGVAAERLRITGFPVSLKFLLDATDQDQQPSNSLHALYFDGACGGNAGRPSCPRSNEGHALTIVPRASRNASVSRPAPLHGRPCPVRPSKSSHGRTTCPKLLQTHSLLVCKAGRCHPCMRRSPLRIPAVIDYVVPGQEEGQCRTSHPSTAAPRPLHHIARRHVQATLR